MLDPKLQELLEELENEGIPPNYTLPVAEARRLSRENVERFTGAKPTVALTKNILIETGDARIPARVYVPRTQRNLPVLIYFHGGGWVLGDLDTSDWLCRSISLAADCTIFSVDYRLAPENRFPTPLEDCYQATTWIAKNGYESYADVSRLAVGGDSAGGNLATAVCLMARQKARPVISYQLLICPVTNHSFDTDSYRKYAEGYLLTRKDMEWFWSHYLRDATDGENAYASPLRADLQSLPAAFVLTAEYDPLRDEGEAYAKRLSEAGVATTMSRYDSMVHCFTDFAELNQTRKAVDEIAARLRSQFSRTKV